MWGSKGPTYVHAVNFLGKTQLERSRMHVNSLGNLVPRRKSELYLAVATGLVHHEHV